MTFLQAGHDVDPSQYERDLPEADQPAGHELDMTVMGWTIRAGYSVIDRLGFQVRLPIRLTLITADFLGQDGSTLADDFDSIHHRDETIGGIGDVELRVMGGLLRPGELGDLVVDLGVGVAFPTGSIEENPFALGNQGKEHQHVFFGGGTFRPILSLSGMYPFESASLSFFAETTLSLYEGRNDYQPPTLVSAGIGVSTGFGLTDWRFMLQQEVFHEEAAQWGSTPAENSGRTDLIATIGAFYSPIEVLTVGLSVRVPYYTISASDEPLRIPAVISLSLTATLDTQEDSK
ncbi:MAG: hypothetical protein ACI9OJ_001964 [Myxococcota bacterium]|jgi:hypothetical protein